MSARIVALFILTSALISSDLKRDKLLGNWRIDLQSTLNENPKIAKKDRAYFKTISSHDVQLSFLYTDKFQEFISKETFNGTWYIYGDSMIVVRLDKSEKIISKRLEINNSINSTDSRYEKTRLLQKLENLNRWSFRKYYFNNNRLHREISILGKPYKIIYMKN